MLRSVFENLIEKQFPAPEVGFLERTQKKNNPKVKSPSPKKNRTTGNLKRKVLKSLEMRPRAKRARVIYSSDSEQEVKKVKVEKMELDSNSDESDAEDEDFAGKSAFFLEEISIFRAKVRHFYSSSHFHGELF